MEVNGDGTYVTDVPTHALYTLEIDTYSPQMKDAMKIDINGSDEDGVYDSNDEASVLDFVPATLWTVSDGAIIAYARVDGEDAEEDEQPAAEGVTFTSDDGGTTITVKTFNGKTAKFNLTVK